MSDKLFVILSFSGIPLGGTQTLPHGLQLNGQNLVPDYVTPNNPGAFEVTAATTTDITLKNNSSGTGNCQVWAQVIHPVHRMLGSAPDDGNINQHMTPQPFVLGSGTGGVIPPSFDQFNVKNFGAVGDGVANDTTAINNAIAAAALTITGGAFGAMVIFPKGTYRVTNTIVLPNGVWLWGEEVPSSEIIASGTPGEVFHHASLITNQTTDGNQEYAGLVNMQFNGNQAAGATCTDAVVSLGGLFVDSSVRNVLIYNGSNVGLHVFCEGSPGGMGPILFENLWVVNNISDNVVLEEKAGNNGAGNGLVFVNLISEHPGPASTALRLKGLGSVAGWSFYNTHIELGTGTGRTGIVLDGVPFVLLDGVQILTGTGGVTAGIQITNVVQNVGIQIRNVTNFNLINPILSDLKNSVTVGNTNLPWYTTPDVVMLGQRFFPANHKSIAIQDSAGTERVWFDDTGALTGASFTGAAIDIVADATNNRAIALCDNNPTPLSRRVFGFLFPDASSFRLRNISGGVDLLQWANTGEMFVYHAISSNLTLQQSLIGPGTNAAAPATGTHARGEIVFNADPVAAGFIGWVCVTGGTPGTWKSWGVISP